MSADHSARRLLELDPHAREVTASCSRCAAVLYIELIAGLGPDQIVPDVQVTVVGGPLRWILEHRGCGGRLRLFR